MNKSIGFMMLENWKDQSCKDAIKWHKDVQKIEEKRLNDFKAGFNSGYWDAIMTLSFHKYIKIDHQK
jgi:hypothetical protein